ncbi:molybdopterin-dependent oxidoreductase [Pseudonocardia sp. N23]|uniref:molybdopterin-dependent oxidoreductase n=1 Tax=Pseudonocardia sp. N23 TaxID=1987376 RepID=UPI00278C5936|nr:molybdopterin-dependent oxidoreductase [Pseudonocardia sp. N23]
MGDTVIRFSPEPLTEFAKTTFGTADKPILLSGMAVVIAVVAAVAGLASRRRPGPGLTVVVVLGLAGTAAVVFGPAFRPVALVAPVVALLVGVATFLFLHRVAQRPTPPAAARAPRNVTPAVESPPSRSMKRGVALGRRSVLFGAVAVAALAAGGASLLLGSGIADARRVVTERLARVRLVETAPPIPANADFAALGTPTFLTRNADFYRIDTALQVPQLTADDWSLNIHGMVGRETALTFDDLMSRPLVERTITMTCVSNPIGGELVSTANFVGVDLRDLLLDIGVRPGADQIFTTSSDGWTTGTPTDVVMEPDRGAMLAVGMNGEALPPEHGFPVRMLVPGLYGYVSACKWIVDMELTTFGARRGYWYQRGWAQKAPIKTQSRVDRPAGFATMPAGTVTCAGIAWSQSTGVGRVEVRMDGGPWRDATLTTAVNGRTWRMWRIDFELAAGSHTVQTRATDLAGRTQVETRTDPIPDGASGWPATIFNVT